MGVKVMVKNMEAAMAVIREINMESGVPGGCGG